MDEERSWLKARHRISLQERLWELKSQFFANFNTATTTTMMWLIWKRHHDKHNRNILRRTWIWQSQIAFYVWCRVTICGLFLSALSHPVGLWKIATWRWGFLYLISSLIAKYLNLEGVLSWRHLHCRGPWWPELLLFCYERVCYLYTAQHFKWCQLLFVDIDWLINGK